MKKLILLMLSVTGLCFADGVTGQGSDVPPKKVAPDSAQAIVYTIGQLQNLGQPPKRFFDGFSRTDAVHLAVGAPLVTMLIGYWIAKRTRYAIHADILVQGFQARILRALHNRSISIIGMLLS